MEQGLRVSVRAIIIRNGMVAVVAFDDESGYHYNLPGGGLEPGETLYEGLRREVREELDCQITIGPLLLVYENQPAPGLAVPPYAIHGLGLFFLCALAPGSEPRLPAEGDQNQVDICWVPLAELKHAPLLPQVGAQLECAIAAQQAYGLPDALVIEDIHTFPPALPNWQPLPSFVISATDVTGPLTGLLNCRQISPRLFSGGMPSVAQLEALAQAGIQVVINLAAGQGEDTLPDESGICARLGLRYLHLPVIWDAPTVDDYLAFERALDEVAERRVLVHCRKNYRASVFVYLWRLRHGEDEIRARDDMLAVWQPNETWQTLIAEVRALGPSGSQHTTGP